MDRDTPLTDVSRALFRLSSVILLPHLQVVPVGAPYFAAHFDEGPQLFVRIKGRFPLQFGR